MEKQQLREKISDKPLSGLGTADRVALNLMATLTVADFKVS
jgi:hypothetical protein